jgi:hypothetical protein
MVWARGLEVMNVKPSTPQQRDTKNPMHAFNQTKNSRYPIAKTNKA